MFEPLVEIGQISVYLAIVSCFVQFNSVSHIICNLSDVRSIETILLQYNNFRF